MLLFTLINQKDVLIVHKILFSINKIHGDKFNVSMITNNHIKGTKSHVPLICNIFAYMWNTTIDIINSKKNNIP